MLSQSSTQETIVALSTPPGTSAIALIRLSGTDAITITNTIFKGKDLTKVDSHTIHFGMIEEGGKVIDEAVVSIFKAPRSYTKENMAEISCHGSPFIIKEIIQALIRSGATLAKAGEFTKRAFL